MTLPDDWPAPPDDGQDEIEVGYRDDADADLFARVQNYVLDHPALSRLGKDAYICLVRHTSWTTRRTKATRARLAGVMSISTDTLDRGIRELEKHGIVEVLKSRDSQGRWRTSSYLLRDTSGARARARIIELEQELQQVKAAVKTGANQTSPQVASSPQIAETTSGDDAGNSGTHSADCGMDQSADCGTVHSAICGHIQEVVSSSSREDQKHEKTRTGSHLAVGADTRRNTRDAATAPPAIDEDSDSEPARAEELARATFSKISVTDRRYGAAKPSFRRAMVRSIARALAAGAGPSAIIVYAQRYALDDTVPLTRHVAHLDRTLARLAADIKAGEACARCGHDPADPYGPICERCRPDRATLTEQDLAELAAAEAFLSQGA